MSSAGPDSLVGQGSDASADGHDARAAAAMGNGETPYCSQKRLRNSLPTGLVGVGQNAGEFLAAVAGSEIVGPLRDLVHRPRNGAQTAITSTMAIGVVEALDV
jgi:hypothetical protein